jgi:hypothetical protein
MTWPTALDLVTDDMVDAFAMAGDVDHWINRMKALEALGVGLFVIYPMVEDKMRMIHRIARDVLPHFRGA